MKHKVVLYIRKSTDSDDRQALSIEKQKDACSELLRGIDYDIIEIFEESITGTKAGIRPWFTKLLKLIRTWKADTIVSWKMSRLARNPIDQAYIETYLQEGKIKKIITTDWVFQPEDNILLMRIFFWVATQYSRDLWKDASEGMLQKVKWWEAVKLPLWYSRVDWKAVKNIDAAAIREAYKLKRSGMSYKNIGIELHNRFWFSSSTWEPMLSSTIQYLLANPFYYGAIRYMGEIFEWKHEPIVSYHEWKEALNTNKKPTWDTREELDFVRWFVLNYETKNRLSAYIKKWNVYFKSTERNLDTINVSLKKVLTYFEENIHKYCIPQEYSQFLIEGLRDFYHKESGIVGDTKEVLNEKIKKSEKKITQLLDMRIDGEISKEEYIELKNKEMIQKEEYLKEIEKLEHINTDILQKSESCFELLVNLSQTWKEANIVQKVSIIKMICSELSFDNKKALYLAERELFEHVRNFNDTIWQASLSELRTTSRMWTLLEGLYRAIFANPVCVIPSRADLI